MYYIFEIGKLPPQIVKAIDTKQAFTIAKQLAMEHSSKVRFFPVKEDDAQTIKPPTV